MFDDVDSKNKANLEKKTGHNTGGRVLKNQSQFARSWRE
jgi:hypothetical protein